MPFVEFIVMLLGILAVATLVYFVMRWTGGLRAREHERIRAFNALLERVAKHRSLSCTVLPDYEHPLVGPSPSYNILGGTIDGLELSLCVKRMSNDETAAEDHIELVLNSGNHNSWPTEAGAFGSRSKGPRDVGPGFAALKAMAAIVEVGAGQLRSRPRGTTSGSSHHVLHSLFKSDEELLHFLDLSVQTCSELRARQKSLLRAGHNGDARAPHGQKIQ